MVTVTANRDDTCMNTNTNPEARPVKVRVVLSLTIDADAVEAEYGDKMSDNELREWVRGVMLTAALTDGIIVPDADHMILEAKVGRD